MKKIGWPGHGYKFTCHVCGFWYPSTEIKKRWDGLMVCPKDLEPRHPQTLIKVRGERAFPDYVSKDGVDQYVPGSVCDIVSNSCYAGLATAGCAQAGNVRFTYDFLLGLMSNGHGPGSFNTQFP
jgi:hypothetical protein